MNAGRSSASKMSRTWHGSQGDHRLIGTRSSMSEYCDPFAKRSIVNPKGKIKIDQIYVLAGQKGHPLPANPLAMLLETAQHL